MAERSASMLKVEAIRAPKDRYDVAILGGGLAGLTLALQLKRLRPNTAFTACGRPALRPALLSATAALALSTCVAGTASAQTADRQTVNDQFTSQLPKSSTGRNFAADFFNPTDPAAKPPVARKVVIELHKGARWNTDAVPQCKATDAELILMGPAACPAASKVGENVVLVDHGFPEPNRFTTSDVTLLNNANELILVSEIRGVPNVPRNVIRGTVDKNRLEISAGFIPGTPPDGGARKRERATFPARSTMLGRRVRNYLTTPPRCPKSGFWTNRATYTYADGVSQTSVSRSPCVKRRRHCQAAGAGRFSKGRRCGRACGRAQANGPSRPGRCRHGGMRGGSGRRWH